MDNLLIASPFFLFFLKYLTYCLKLSLFGSFGQDFQDTSTHFHNNGTPWLKQTLETHPLVFQGHFWPGLPRTSNVREIKKLSVFLKSDATFLTIQSQ